MLWTQADLLILDRPQLIFFDATCRHGRISMEDLVLVAQIALSMQLPTSHLPCCIPVGQFYFPTTI